MRIVVVAFVLSFKVCLCQVAQIIPLEVRFEYPIPQNGSFPATIRWYDTPTSGSVLHEERTILVVEAGSTTLYCGKSIPLPARVIRGGQRWVGITIDGESERNPRVAIVPTFTALAAHVADVADRLSSGASGVVTSINEQSGPIWFRGENGITVRKDSTTFTIAGVGGGQHLSGVIMGSGSADYDIELPALPLHPHDVVVSIESPNTTILAQVVAILPMLPGIRIRASAYVLPEERIHWYMIPR